MRSTQRPFVWFYFMGTFAWSWFFWGLILLGWGQALKPVWMALGGLGPALAGMVFTYQEGGREALRDYGRRLVEVRRIPAWVWGAAVLIMPVILLMAGQIDLFFGGQGVQLDARDFAFTKGLPLVLAIPAAILFFWVVGPLPEEMGWRGYALDRLQQKMGPMRASVVLALFWVGWHIPLTLMSGAFGEAFSPGSTGFWLLVVDFISVSILMTWLYNQSNRSILIAVLFHFDCNMTLETIHHDNLLEAIRIALGLVVVAVVIKKDWFLGYPFPKSS